MKGDPVNDIPPFQGHPIGGPVYTNTPRTPWLPDSAVNAAPAGRGGGAGRGTPAQGRGAAGTATDSRYGLDASGADPTMVLNERDWLDCIKSRNRPFCEVEDGHRVATTCNLANMSLRLGRSIKWDPEKQEVVGDKEAASMAAGIALHSQTGHAYRAPWDAELRKLVKV
jgi:hypothetical protein